MRIDVDSGSYTLACTDLYDCNHAIIDAVSTLDSQLGSGSSMAGSDTGGQEWAAQYDQVAAQLVQAGADLGEAMGQSANLLNAALINHQGADYGAQVATPAQYQTETSDGDPDPDHWVETLSPAAPPSASGGTGDMPGWLSWLIDHLEGLLWPDADTGKMRTIGQDWITAGTTIGAYAYVVDAAKGHIQTQESPEIADAVAACDELKQHTTDLAAAYKAIGQACNDYAKHVDDHHQMIEDELASFIEWTAGIEIAGGILAFFTAGISEAAAQAPEAAEVANAASKVVKILKALLELAKAVAETIGALLSKVVDVISALKKFLSAKAIAALEKVGIDLGKAAAKVAQYGAKIEKQLAKRGWTKETVDEALENPSRVVKTRDTRWNPDGTKMDDPATAYINEDGSYVVQNDVTGDIVQVSDRNDPNWKSPWE